MRGSMPVGRIGAGSPWPPSDLSLPLPPKISLRLLLEQFWADVYGKEVQSAATYSYTWLADQVGHICLGILLDFGFTVITYRLSAWLGWPALSAEFLGFFLTMAAVSYWEYRAYRSDVERATGPFPLDRKLLRKNAIIAAGYMILGGAVGLLFHWPAHYAVPGFLVILLVAIVLAPAWLRQKIIWQKAGLPYLFRLANAHHTILEPAANALQKLVRSAAPPHALARQVILSGPVQSGRTSLAAGIGTEFAFLAKSVRYLSLDRLVEFAMASKPDAAPPIFCDEWGPVNVRYWPWRQAQVLIIDDISPLLGSAPTSDHYTHFAALLGGPLRSIGDLLSTRHTVWVLGDVGSPEQLDKFAAAISAYCKGTAPLAILLSTERVVAVHGPESSVETR